MILVVVASSTVACGGRRELPKSPGLMMPLLQSSPWLRLRAWTSSWCGGEAYGDDERVLGGRVDSNDGETESSTELVFRERKDMQTEREKKKSWCSRKMMMRVLFHVIFFLLSQNFCNFPQNFLVISSSLRKFPGSTLLFFLFFFLSSVT